MPVPKKIRVGIVGTGFGLYGLLPALLRDHRADVVGIAGRSPETAEKVRTRSDRDLKIFSSHRELIRDGALDAVAIAVPPRAQEEIASFALEKKLSVFAEKPLAVSLPAARALLDAARRSSRAHMVDFMFSEIEAWQKTKACLSDPQYGPFHHLHYRWLFESYDYKSGLRGWKTDASEGGGLLRYFASHVFYNLEFLVGKIQSLRSRLLDHGNPLKNGETSIDLDVNFQNGMTASVQMSCIAKGKSEHVLDFVGDRGTLTLENTTVRYAEGFGLTFHERDKKSVLHSPSNDGVPSREDERVAPVSRLIKRFFDWVETGREQEPNFQQAFRVQELIASAEASQERFVSTS